MPPGQRMRHYPYSHRMRESHCLWDATTPDPPGSISTYCDMDTAPSMALGKDRYNAFWEYVFDTQPFKYDSQRDGMSTYTFYKTNPSSIPPPDAGHVYVDPANGSETFGSTVLGTYVGISFTYTAPTEGFTPALAPVNDLNRADYRNIVDSFAFRIPIDAICRVGYTGPGAGFGGLIASFQIIGAFNLSLRSPGPTFYIDSEANVSKRTVRPTIWKPGVGGEGVDTFSTVDMGLEIRFNQLVIHALDTVKHAVAIADVEARYAALQDYLDNFSLDCEIRRAAHPRYWNENTPSQPTLSSTRVY